MTKRLITKNCIPIFASLMLKRSVNCIMHVTCVDLYPFFQSQKNVSVVLHRRDSNRGKSTGEHQEYASRICSLRISLGTDIKHFCILSKMEDPALLKMQKISDMCREEEKRTAGSEWVKSVTAPVTGQPRESPTWPQASY